MFLTIWLKYFFDVKSPMETPLDSSFFTHNFFFSYQSGYIWPYTWFFFSVRSKTFLYDSIWLKNFNFCQKSYGKKTRVNFFSHKIDQKVASIFASISYYAQKLNENQQNGSMLGVKDILGTQQDINLFKRNCVIWKFIRRLKDFA